jgi:outer membrane protein OmpA-like peptidoglycan-associated protein
MRAARRAPLVLALPLLLVAASVSAQTAGASGIEVTGSSLYAPTTGPIAPDFGGEIGLFTIPTGDTLPPHGFSLGLYLQNTKLVAGESQFFPAGDKRRMYEQSSFQGSIGYGLTRHIEIFAAAGEDRFESRGGWLDGVVNGLEFAGGFERTEPRKVRLGAKVNLWSTSSNFRLALYAAANAPIGNDQDHVNTRRTDWDWGLAATKGIVTANVSYQLSGRRSTDPDVRVPNRLRLAVGTEVPFGPYLHWISEIDRNIFDNPTIPEGSSDIKPKDYSILDSGVRFFIGRTGWAVAFALNLNVDMIARTKFSPTPIGGLLAITYAPFPPPPPAARPLPPVEAREEERTETTSAEAPPPPSAVSAAPQSKSTTDEILFDKASARLTNIAKAILDGVALRMKNDLNSTAVVTGYSDNAGSEEANMKISQQRADAARKYLVDRHGIDAARITTVARGSAEPAGDNTTDEGRAKNRRAVIVVTFVPGS